MVIEDPEKEMLIRIDERTSNLISRFDTLELSLKKEYVKRDEFWPVRVIVYTGAGTTLLAVVGAVIAVVIR